VFGIAFRKRFWKKLNFFFFFLLSSNMFLMFSDHFDMLISKLILKKIKKNIILMCFGMKSNRYHTLKYTLSINWWISQHQIFTCNENVTCTVIWDLRTDPWMQVLWLAFKLVKKLQIDDKSQLDLWICFCLMNWSLKKISRISGGPVLIFCWKIYTKLA
jgi:hypothetical protein